MITCARTTVGTGASYATSHQMMCVPRILWFNMMQKHLTAYANASQQSNEPEKQEHEQEAEIYRSIQSDRTISLFSLTKREKVLFWFGFLLATGILLGLYVFFWRVVPQLF
jgi:hypothetical protein